MVAKLTLKEISKLADVSISTVSRVLSNSEEVKEDTKRKVLAVVQESSPLQIRKRSGLIALIIPDITNPFFPLLLKGIESIARLQGYNLIISNSESNPQMEEQLLTNLGNTNIDGLIYVGTGPVAAEYFHLHRSKNIPVVFLDRDPEIENVNLVTADNLEGMYQSAKYLLGLGHTDIIYLGGPEHLSVEKQRFQGLSKALSELHYDSQMISRFCANYSIDDAYKIISYLYTEKGCTATAICASNDLMALGAHKALTDNGLLVPKNVSIIGYDDIPAASLLNLTTVKQPFEEMGRNAMMVLLNGIQTQLKIPMRLVLGTSLIIRNSCATAEAHHEHMHNII